jgi:hypothetical protein
VLIREERVSARFRYFERVQQGAEGGPGFEGDVRMPDLGERAFLAAVLNVDDRRVSLEVREDRVDQQGAEALCERDLLVGRQLLVAEDEDMVLEESRADFGDLSFVEIRDVEVIDLGSERARKRDAVDRQGRSLG